MSKRFQHLKHQIDSALGWHWPEWSWEIAAQQTASDYQALAETTHPKNKSSQRARLWDTSQFNTMFAAEKMRRKQINMSYIFLCVALFLAGVSTLVYISGISPLSFWPAAFFILLLTCVLMKIRDLKSRRPEYDLGTFLENGVKAEYKKPVVKLAQELRNNNICLFFQDDHGTYFKLTRKISTAQNWFFLLSPNQDHLRGVSMMGKPPTGRLMLLKSDAEKLAAKDDSSLNARVGLHLSAVLHEEEFMIAFVKAADKSRKTKTLTRPRKKWLSTVRIIDEDWSKWSSYRDGKLRGEERNDYELLLLEALTEDSNASESNINLLSKFIDARVRPLNKWIYDLNVVPQEFIDNMRQKPYR